MNTRFLSSLFLGALLSGGTALRANIALDFVTVDDDGNPNDSTTGYGGVGYDFRIGTYEVTLAQYAAFLNAIAATDTFGLYNTGMATNLNVAGIARTGADGSFTYSVIGEGRHPVAFVSWFDAARFCNWLHNGQPNGPQDSSTTENGAYGLNGATTGVEVFKSAEASFWIPSENEWYKAAYYQPTVSGGDTDGFWMYPTRSNTAPGNMVGGTENQANYVTANNYFSVTQSSGYVSTQNYLTSVGTYAGSAGYFGTFDQGGSLWEWNDAVISISFRGLRGGSWADGNPAEGGLRAESRNINEPINENHVIGFRVATLADSDSDGIPDRYETGTGINLSPKNTGTNPTIPDTDGDGLNDGEELTRHLTDPNVTDSDGDGFGDGFEVGTGFNPASAASTPDTQSSVRTAVEYRFNAALGASYRIEASTDFATWTTVETNIVGSGGVISRLYSIEGQPKRFFRSRRN